MSERPAGGDRARGDRDLGLLRRFRGGDASALDELVERHNGAVYSFVRRFLRHDAAADDVTQEVWLRVLRGKAPFDGRSRFTTWLFQVARNACIDHVRKASRRPESVGEPPEPADRSRSVPEEVGRRELSARIEAVVAELPEGQREVFLLREQTDLTFTEIAEALGVNRETVKSRFRYALGQLRAALSARSAGEDPRGL